MASPRDAVTILNRVLFENIRHRLIKDDFVTLTLLRIMGQRLVCAGAHEHFLVCRARTGSCEQVETPGTWLGVMPEVGAFTTETVVDLEPNDLVVLYTDGITEARGDRPLSPTALADALQPVLPEGAGAIARRAVCVAEELAGGALRDDVAVLVVRLTER
jgi:sigma-B regulation protein RsbU (phosphoserine phosphatase)